MKIIIPGVPIPQGRMRHRSLGKHVMTYDPKAKEKKAIREALMQVKDIPSFEFPRISFLFCMPIPKSTTKKQMAIYEKGNVKHDKKPDVDNLIKLYLDCLDGIIFHGDQKVSLGSSVKVYHMAPKTIIWINETTNMLEPRELDTFLDAKESGELSFSV